MLYRCKNGHEVHFKRKPSDGPRWIHYGQYIIDRNCTECGCQLKEVKVDTKKEESK